MMSEPELLGYSTIDKAQPVPSSDEETMDGYGDRLPPVENQESVSPPPVLIEDNTPSPPPYSSKDMPPDSHQNGIYDSQNGKTKPVDLPMEEVPLGTEAAKEDTTEKKSAQLVSVGQLFRFADGLDWLLMIIGSLCALAHGAALPAMLVVFGDMTDSFVKSGSADSLNETESIAILDQLLDEMSTFSLYYVGIACGVLVAGYAQVGFWLITSYRQIQRVREKLFKSILKMEIGWFDTTDVGELNTRLSDDVNKIREGIGDKIGNFLQWMSTFLTGFIIGFIKGWKLALVIVSISPLLAACGGIMAYLISSVTKKELDAYAKAGSVAEEVLSSIRTVFAFSGQKKECDRYSSHLDSARRFGLKKGMAGGGGMGLIFFIIFSCYALAFWYGAKLVREEPHNYTLGTMLIVFFCVVMGAFGIGNALPNIQHVATARGAAYSLWDIIDRVPAIDSSSVAGIVPDKLDGHIQLRDVHFAYPSRPDVPVLKGVTMEARVGQTVALVGSSGCGKSTIVQLILRFYDALSGSVLLDGQPIDKLNLKWLRQHIGLVSQEPVLFGTTIEENIRYGYEGVTHEEIEQAAQEANAYNFIMELPHKFETLVGERGAQLSGGQKQRIAIARALVRNPRILLLDEATSALDTESEKVVQEALDRAQQGRTSLVIAHRLSTIQNAHCIVVFQRGKISEMGTHAELLSKKGIYYKLSNVQNKRAI